MRISPPAGSTLEILEAVRRAPTLLAALDLMDALTAAARLDGSAAADPLRDAIGAASDDLTGIAAVHAAAAAGAATAAGLLVPLLTSPSPHLREHAAWALSFAPRIPEAMPALEAMTAAGGFTGTLAELTLEAWGLTPDDPEDLDEPRPVDERRGLTVAQLYLHADIDGTLLHAGQGDTGGIATLLVHLGDALLTEGAVDRVLTLSRGNSGRVQIPAEYDQLKAKALA